MGTGILRLVASSGRRCALLFSVRKSNDNLFNQNAPGSVNSGFPVLPWKCNRSPDVWPGFSWLRTSDSPGAWTPAKWSPDVFLGFSQPWSSDCVFS